LWVQSRLERRAQSARAVFFLLGSPRRRRRQSPWCWRCFAQSCGSPLFLAAVLALCWLDGDGLALRRCVELGWVAAGCWLVGRVWLAALLDCRCGQALNRSSSRSARACEVRDYGTCRKLAGNQRRPSPAPTTSTGQPARLAAFRRKYGSHDRGFRTRVNTNHTRGRGRGKGRGRGRGHDIKR